MRARDLGAVIGEHPTGEHNAITDVAGVRVGHVTLDETGPPAVHTGVTVVVPHPDIWNEPVFAGTHRLNGSGELTGLEWIRESGELTTAIALTNTHSVGVVRDALVEAQVQARGDGVYWSLPVVGETYDGVLSDINGHHVRADHVREALASASEGPVAEGNVGGGTGMICHEFKGGIGTSSRVTDTALGQYTVGVLVQANHGRRELLRVNGIPVGELIGPDRVPLPQTPAGYEPGSGSIIVVVATNAPLLPHQCARLAQRAAVGVARVGGAGEQYSGDLMLAFSTGNRGIPPYAWDEDTLVARPEIPLRMVAATTLTGRNGIIAHAVDHDLLRQALAQPVRHQEDR